MRWDRNWYTTNLGGPQFTDLMNKREKFQHDKDNDAFGLVWRSLRAPWADGLSWAAAERLER